MPADVSTQRALRIAEGVIISANNKMTATQVRSTEEQRQAFMEHLYTDYAELHAQKDEILSRKHKMDFDMYESNNGEIHDLLFGHIDVQETQLGDMDTWEKVEAVVKRYAYGRPKHTSAQKDEMTAMKSHLNTLADALKNEKQTVAELKSSSEAVQQELVGVLKLLRMKENEISTLTSQHVTVKLQLRHVQRERDALRGVRRQEDPSQLMQDLKFLIAANKKLEKENNDLRGRLYVNETFFSNGAENPPFVARQASSTFQAMDLKPSTPRQEVDIEQLTEDDALRQAYVEQHLPISCAIVEAKRTSQAWKRRLEAEVHNTMEQLDMDAGWKPVSWESLEAAHIRDIRGQIRLENGIFTSYAGYGALIPAANASATVVSMAPRTSEYWESSICAEKKTSLSTAGETAPSTHLSQPSDDDAAAQSSMVAFSKTKDNSPAPRKKKGKPAKLNASVVSTSAKAKPPVVKKDSGLPSEAATRVQPPKAPSPIHCPDHKAKVALLSEVMRMAELSRGSALRRELLHVQQLRRSSILAEENYLALLQSHSFGAAFNPHGLPAVTNISASSIEAPGTNFSEESAGLQEGGELQSQVIYAASHYKISQDGKVAMRLRSEVDYSRQEADGNGPYPFRVGATEEYDTTQSMTALGTHSIATLIGHDNIQNQSTVNSGGMQTLLHPQSESYLGDHAAGGAERPQENNGAPATFIAEDGTKLGTGPTASHEVAMIQQMQSHNTAALSDQASFSGKPFRNEVTSSLTPLPVDGAQVQAYLRSRHPKSIPMLRMETQQLHSDLNAIRSLFTQMQKEVFDLFEVLREVQGTSDIASELTHSGEMESAANAVQQRIVDTLAIDHATRLLQKKYGLNLKTDDIEQPLPDSATDEEWVSHQLRTVAVEMAKQAVARGTAASTTTSPYVASPKAHFDFADEKCSSPTRGADAVSPLLTSPGNYFDDDVARVVGLPMFSDYGILNDYLAAMDGEDASRPGEKVPQMVVSGRQILGKGNAAPLPRLQQQWYLRKGMPAPARSAPHHQPHQHPSIGPMRYAGLLFSQLRGGMSGEDGIQSIQPTVLRYDFKTAAQRMSEEARRRTQLATSYLYGQDFADFVRDYIVPIVGAANHVSSGGMLDAQLVEAVKQLRQEERARRKRGVQLLFSKVLNNIRTRRLIRTNVYHGDGFYSYVGLLYNRWRANVERARQELRQQLRKNQIDLLQLMQLKNTPQFATPKPSPRSSSRPRNQGNFSTFRVLGASSFHFDKVKFRAKKK